MREMLLELVSLHREESDLEVPVEGLPVLIGRAGDAAVRVDRPEVSRHHCEVYPLNSALVVRDLKSTNGTYVNGLRVTETLLLPGDKLTLGATRYLVRYERGSTDTPAPAVATIEEEMQMTDTMPETACGWSLHVDRRSNCLLVTALRRPDGLFDHGPLAERLLHLMEEHGVYQVVLELDEVEAIDGVTIRQLGLLNELARERGGLIRLCGLSPGNSQLVVRNGLGDVFPPYRDRHEAMFASGRPCKPR
jgi:pSer/pThr/pTyr-binding forkhead associated (FHA) protein